MGPGAFMSEEVLRPIPIRASPCLEARTTTRKRRTLYPFKGGDVDHRDRIFLATSAYVRIRSAAHVDATVGRIFVSSMSIDKVFEEVNEHMRRIYWDIPPLRVRTIDRPKAQQLAGILTVPDRRFAHMFLIPDETLRQGWRATGNDSYDDLPRFLEETAICAAAN